MVVVVAGHGRVAMGRKEDEIPGSAFLLYVGHLAPFFLLFFSLSLPTGGFLLFLSFFIPFDLDIGFVDFR